MTTFKMSRGSDESGVSGTGIVLEGVIFLSGEVVVSWLTNNSSIGIYHSYKDFINIHVISHPTNKSIITFDDGNTEEY